MHWNKSSVWRSSVSLKNDFTQIDSQSTVFILESRQLLYLLEEILRFNLIYRMLGIDSGITERSGLTTHVATFGDVYPFFGIAVFRDSGASG